MAIPVLLRNRHEAVIRRWIDQLPRDVVESRPVLEVGFVSALAASNEFGGLEERLQHVDRVLARPLDGQVVADHEAWARLPAAVSKYRAALALVAGDLAGTVVHAELALARAEDDDHVTIASCSALVALVAWTDGELAAAHAAYRVAAEHLALAGHVADVLGCTITLVDIELTQGRLRDAERSCRGALALAASDPTPPRGTADMHVCLSRVAWERGDLAGVAEHLRAADELGESAGLPKYPYRWRVSMAHLRAAEGDIATAVALLEEAERVYVADFAPNVQPVAATRARVLAASGDALGALAWVRDSGVSATDDASYLHEYEHVTLARTLLADHAASGSEASLTVATVLLDRLLTAAETGGRAGVVIEVLVLQAIARAAGGVMDPALASLERAVRLAEPEGQVRVFTAEGAPMRALLTTLATRHPGQVFVGRLLGSRGGSTRPAGGPVASPIGSDTAGGASTSAAADGAQGLLEPLSGRELDVLRYLGSDLDGPAIARVLGVSLSTVRTHTQHVYTKLGVTNRRAAVRRAHQLNLFSRSVSR
jgi:LuxR family maltose regulon positive regulatory protein